MTNREKYEGKVFNTNNYGSLIVEKYLGYRNVHVRFIETGYQTSVCLNNMLKGEVKDKGKATVEGFGTLSTAIITEPRVYMLWNNMLKRCYGQQQQDINPTYVGCTVSDNFRQLPYFQDWCHNQIGFDHFDENGKPFALDKDILVKGNKVYSEDSCVFVPREMNSLLLTRSRFRGSLPLGVSFLNDRKKYRARCSLGGNNKTIGYYNTEEDAFYAYKQVKERYIKEVAYKWKGTVDNRVYESLMNWEVSIDD